MELLAIVNTPAPRVPPTGPVIDPGQARWIETIAHAWEEVAGKPVPVSASDLDGLDDEAQLQVLRGAMVSADLLPAEADVNYIRGLVNVFRANSLARYHPDEVVPVPIQLFRASEFHAQFDFSAAEDTDVPSTQSTLGWKVVLYQTRSRPPGSRQSPDDADRAAHRNACAGASGTITRCIT